MPKKMRSNFRFSVLLSKPSIGIGLATVTVSPFATFDALTAAQTSPSAVFSFR